MRSTTRWDYCIVSNFVVFVVLNSLGSDVSLAASQNMDCFRVVIVEHEQFELVIRLNSDSD